MICHADSACYSLTSSSEGLDEEGLYRKPGIVSKQAKLLKECMEKGRLDKIDFTDEFEWDTKTIASAVKGYFSKHLGEPLLTFALHSQFIESASELVYQCSLVTHTPVENRGCG